MTNLITIRDINGEEVRFIRYAGGKKNGAMLQISIDKSYVEIKKEQVESLISRLKDGFDIE